MMKGLINAPSWAKWVTMDSTGKVYFHENKPKRGVYVWGNSGKKELASSNEYSYGNWKRFMVKIETLS